jgi:hypothetical protein
MFPCFTKEETESERREMVQECAMARIQAYLNPRQSPLGEPKSLPFTSSDNTNSKEMPF